MSRPRKTLLTLIALGFVVGVAAQAIHAGTDKQGDLATMVANAKTAADHEAIAKKYDAMAAEEKSRAAMHAKMGQNYKSMGGAAIGKYHMDAHCESIVKNANATAADYESMAAAHRQMAAAAK
jgi:uncharacterized membrane protein YeaQ/YmgE (transglycosylase-associated protein family)